MKSSNVKDWHQFAQVTLSYLPHYRNTDQPEIESSLDAYLVFKKVWDMGAINLVEDAWMILLDANEFLIAVQHISRGGTRSAIVDPKIVFTTALLARASYIIIAHNHPSKAIVPSRADQKMTAKLIEVGDALQLGILDHLIISDENYFSFADAGIIKRKSLG